MRGGPCESLGWAYAFRAPGVRGRQCDGIFGTFLCQATEQKVAGFLKWVTRPSSRTHPRTAGFHRGASLACFPRLSLVMRLPKRRDFKGDFILNVASQSGRAYPPVTVPERWGENGIAALTCLTRSPCFRVPTTAQPRTLRLLRTETMSSELYP